MPNPKTNKATPLSVRLTQTERDTLLARAGGETLSNYVKQILFDGPPSAYRGLPMADRALLSHLLATLGGSNLAPNLDRLADDAEMGILIEDKETTRLLRQACDDVRLMHNALMRGLGRKEKAPSLREAGLTATFNRAAKPDPEDIN